MEQKVYARYLRTECGVSYREIAKRCKMSKTSTERICKKSLRKEHPKKNVKMGRPRKVDARSLRALIRTLNTMRERNEEISVRSLVVESGLNFNQASRRTFSRALNNNGYGFFQRRKKGLVTEKDRKMRQQFGKEMKRCVKRNANFWKDEVSFYLDGVSFIHKHNPTSSATTGKARVWRKKGEGLMYTGKGSKELAGGRRLHVIVAIAFGKGVILAVPYVKMDGAFFARFIREHFNITFARAGPKHGSRRLFVMDNDPSQTSKLAMSALREIEAELLKIPARSPDLNPIENVFHLVKTYLAKQAVRHNIVSESFDEFQIRVLAALDGIPTEVVDRTISSMSKRIETMVKSKGYRTRY